jgi:two-component system cell cycle response regulator DivK
MDTSNVRFHLSAPEESQASLGSPQPTADIAARPLILIAEDDPDNRLMMKTLLEMKSYRIEEAANGEEAVAKAASARPDLILVDLQLPLLNGFAVTRFVRQQDGLREIPIVVVSGHDPSKHLKLALAAGCNGYIQKPIDFDELDQLLCKLLNV